MLRFLPFVVLPLTLWAGSASPADDEKVAANKPVSFFREVRPLFQRHCQGCHQPAKALGKLDLTTHAAFKRGGDNGEGFIAGKADESVVLDYITGEPPRMPKGGGPPFTADQVELIRRWINEGAVDDSPAGSGTPIAPDAPPVYRQPPVLSALAFSPDGQMLAVSGYHEILLHQHDGGALLHRLVGVSPRIEDLTFSPDGKFLAAAAGSPGLFGEVQLWDLARMRLRHSVTLSHDTLYGLSFSPDGTKLAVGAADHAVRMLAVADGKLEARLDHHQDWVLGTAFAVSGGAATKNRQQNPGARENVAQKMDDGKLHLISVSRDRAMKLTEADTGSFVDDINKLLEGLFCLALHPGGQWIACGGEDQIPRMYQIFRTRARVMMDDDLNLVRTFERQEGPISTLAFSPDGNWLAVACMTGGEVRVYATADGKRVATLPGHGGGVFALAWRPDGKLLATGGHDGQVRLFALPDGTLTRQFIPVPLASQP